MKKIYLIYYHYYIFYCFNRNSKWGINTKMQTLLTELDHGLSKTLRHSVDKNQGIYILK